MAIRFADLFCGAGGWTQGLKAEGWVHIAGIDKDPYATATYAHNHGRAPTCTGDITVMTSDSARTLVGRAGVDVVAASPPCQSLSHVGPRQTGHPNDTLFEHVPRLAHAMGAHVVVMENVVGFLSKRFASGERVFDGVADSMRMHGYVNVAWRTLMCCDYGVPQKRCRVVVVAGRAEIDVERVCVALQGMAKPDPPPPPLGELLEPRALVTDPYYWMTDQKRAYYEARAAHIRTRNYVHFVDLCELARTLRAGYAKSRGQEGLVRYPDGCMRMLTERECARIQSFPDTYTFVGSRTRVYTQIGNAVPPNFANAVATAIEPVLREMVERTDITNR